jgi:hypothetical protein
MASELTGDCHVARNVHQKSLTFSPVLAVFNQPPQLSWEHGDINFILDARWGEERRSLGRRAEKTRGPVKDK